MGISVRAKMLCISITHYVANRHVSFLPVLSGSEENKSFAKATPGGKLELYIDASTSAYDVFEVGKEYYVDITLAE
jgi:hypothetical protein